MLELTIDIDGAKYKKVKISSADCNGCIFLDDQSDRCALVEDNEGICVEHDNLHNAVFYILQNIDIES